MSASSGLITIQLVELAEWTRFWGGLAADVSILELWSRGSLRLLLMSGAWILLAAVDWAFFKAFFAEGDGIGIRFLVIGRRGVVGDGHFAACPGYLTDCRSVADVLGSSFGVEIVICDFRSVFERRAFDALLEHSTNVYGHLPKEHFLLNIIEGDVLCLVVQQRRVLGRTTAITF